jgi:peptide-methionine (S)-S-oxide reductase
MKLILFLLLSLSIFPQEKTTTEIAIFAGGCFWCMEPPYDAEEGVKETISGYTGGDLKNPSYEQVSAGGTGHAEAIKIIYDPKKISYERLLEIFWKNIDPTVANRQFCDTGTQYRSGIFYLNEKQKLSAEKSKQNIEKILKPIYTEITKFKEFYPAEDYHQDYYKKNPLRYKYYRSACGRDKRLKEVWGN